MPVCSNLSYVITPSHSTTRISDSETCPSQVRDTNQGSEVCPEYSSFGPDYETIDSRRQSQRINQTHARDRLLSERYEYSEAHLEAATAAGGVPEVSANYEVPLSLGQNVCTEDEDYSHLKH